MVTGLTTRPKLKAANPKGLTLDCLIFLHVQTIKPILIIGLCQREAPQIPPFKFKISNFPLQYLPYLHLNS